MAIDLLIFLFKVIVVVMAVSVCAKVVFAHYYNEKMGYSSKFFKALTEVINQYSQKKQG